MDLVSLRWAADGAAALVAASCFLCLVALPSGDPASPAPPVAPTSPTPDRQDIPTLTAVATPVSTITSTQAPQVGLVVDYDVAQTLTVLNQGPGTAAKVLLWVAMVRSVEPYQEVISTAVTPEEYEVTTDEHGNVYALFEFRDVSSQGSERIELRYRVAVSELRFDLGSCEGLLPDTFISPVPYIESDAEPVVTLAGTLAEGKGTACEKVRAFYDYVGDNVSHTGYDPESKGALAALQSLTGDCTDYADLTIALSRAAGVPARFLEGLTCCTGGTYAPGDVKHDWLEVYLPGTGWVPVDPTWGRSPSDRDTYFAGITPDHVIVTRGRNPAPLAGYHYFYYQYWWGATATDGSTDGEVSVESEWRVVEADE